MEEVKYSEDGKTLLRVPENYCGEFVVPEGVTTIGEAALIYCSQLTNVKFPTTLKTIGAYAFKFCRKLESVDIPNSVVEIGEYAFWGCHSLANVVLSNKLSVLKRNVFKETPIIDIVIPDSVKKIEDDAFEDCYDIQNVQLPNNIEIADSAFKGCSAMIQADALYLNLYNNPHYKLVKVYAHAQNFVIPDDVVEIGGNIFADKCKIRSLVIPNSVKKIHSNAFRNCM